MQINPSIIYLKINIYNRLHLCRERERERERKREIKRERDRYKDNLCKPFL